MLKLKKIQTESYNDYPLEHAYFPYLTLNSKQISELKDWEVGETYQIILEIKQKSKSESETKDLSVINSTFDITAYKVISGDISDADLEEMQGLALSSK